MTNCSVTNELLEQANNHVWVIERITNPEETEELFLERNRIGEKVKPIHPLQADELFAMLYAEGEKQGGLLSHGQIKRVKLVDDSRVKVYTDQFMYRLRIYSEFDEEVYFRTLASQSKG